MKYTLNISKDGNVNMALHTTISVNGLVSVGYNRIITVNKHPYVEFEEDYVILRSFFIPKDQLYRFSDKRVYYIRFVNLQKPVEMRYQLMDYSFFKKGMFYISAFDLYTIDNTPVAKFAWNDTPIICNADVTIDGNEFFGVK